MQKTLLKLIKTGSNTFVIKIRSCWRHNPTTGFNWYVKDFDEGALAVHETKYEKLDKDEAKLAGAPSLADIKIEALKQGMFSFCLSYMRNWEGGEVIETYRFDVESDGDRKICVKNVKKILNN